MHPVQDTRTARPTVVDPHEFTRALAAAALSIALAGIVLATIAFVTSQPETTAHSSAVSAGELIDGWSSYLGAAAQPADLPIVDGWSSYLLVEAVDPNTVFDGWSSYLLTTELKPETLVDGWAARYGNGG